MARLHVPVIVASDCKWRSWKASPIGLATSRNSLVYYVVGQCIVCWGGLQFDMVVYYVLGVYTVW